MSDTPKENKAEVIEEVQEDVVEEDAAVSKGGTPSEKVGSSKSKPDGTVSLVLSIVGLVFFQFICIVSLFLSLRDKKAYTSNNLPVPGTITAAIIISIVGIGILVAGIIAVIAIVIVGGEMIEGASN